MSNLKTRFEEILHMEWGTFYELENNKSSSIDDTILCSLIRVCADSDDISAIKLAFDRADGALQTLIDIKVPKFYVRYINATESEVAEKVVEQPTEQKNVDKSSYDPATAKLRETLTEMRSLPRDVIRAVLLYKKRIDKGTPVETEPTVKAVIVANLLKNVTKGRFKAIELVFDQIDGKLPKSIELLGGEDVYVDDYNTLTAPSHAIKDENGHYIAENKIMTNMWIRGFANSGRGLEALAKGLEDD